MVLGCPLLAAARWDSRGAWPRPAAGERGVSRGAGLRAPCSARATGRFPRGCSRGDPRPGRGGLPGLPPPAPAPAHLRAAARPGRQPEPSSRREPVPSRRRAARRFPAAARGAAGASPAPGRCFIAPRRHPDTPRRSEPRGGRKQPATRFPGRLAHAGSGRCRDWSLRAPDS